ncbi:MAG: hypothetical protein NW224_02630 [Leptolyngbyaceae cyanobacterium bins.302]|nr:hypothetical protein [Leptolyngbyaceae cyanobacterium bins.302]
MTVDNTAKSNGRGGKATSSRSRTRSTKAEAPAVTANDAMQETSASNGTALDAANVNEDVMSEPAMATDNVTKIDVRPSQSEEGAIALSQPVSMIWNRPVMPSEIEVAETMSVAGVRPIAASHLELAGSFLNGRPIEASHLKVHEMLGNSPIFESEFKMVEGAMLPGNRPILASSPELLAGSMLPGNRPIASNETVDPEPAVLMGYLD